jgi:hypothetical protein
MNRTTREKTSQETGTQTMLPGTVAHIYNPSYSGGDCEDPSSRPAWAKVLKTPSQPIKRKKENKLCVVACTCHPSCMGSINRRTDTQTGPGINPRPYQA